MWTAGTILVATFLASITDWLFMDLLVHRTYIAEPAIWRPSTGSFRIVVSQIVGTVATASAILLERMMPINPLLLAIALWCAGALPICAQNTQWLRMKPSIGISHATGWLARLAIATCLARMSQL
jgi:hypothetical protein